MNTKTKLTMLALSMCVASLSGLRAEEAPRHTSVCAVEVDAFRKNITVKQSSVLELLEAAIKAHPSCSCEFVKASIQTTNAKSDEVAAIVEVAVISSPENTRIIAQCAVAVAPDSLEAVQNVLAKLDPSTGESGMSGKEVAEKGGMPAKQGESGNPLDFPTNGEQVVVGPGAGEVGGFQFMPLFGAFQPPFVVSNPATDNNL